jgi:3-dehydroquinate synthase
MNNKPDERVVEVHVKPRPYPVFIGVGLFGDLGSRVRNSVAGKRALVITDETVGPLHAQPAVASMRAAGFETQLVTVPPGEHTKSLEWVARLYDKLAEFRMDRTCPVLALGGGVVGDLAGFAAATWMRGLPFVQCPTTIVSDVDASVGGKTGVNHASGKNMIGSFYQPLFVLIDTATLQTLGERDFRAGLAESIKHAVIRDTDFFSWHEQNVDHLLACDTAALAALVEHNVRIKASIVSQDERETTGLRALLNFGHTVGHAIETIMSRGDNPWRHGECVAVGMAAAAEISVAAGKLDRASAERIVALLDRASLPTQAPLASRRDEILSLMHSDKKVAAGQIRFVLADRIGWATLYDNLDPEWVEAGLTRVLG